MLESDLKPNSTGVSVSPEVLASDLTRWTLGPYHPALPGPMKVKLLLDGEVVVQASTETGFTHRGIEQIFEQESWTAGISLSDRVDAEAAVFGELVYCQAVERLLGLNVSQRSLSIRTLVSELSRIVSHLGYISRLARVMGAETLFHYVSRDREKFIDLSLLRLWLGTIFISGRARHALCLLFHYYC